MKKPEEVKSIEDLVGYTILAAAVFGPIVVWDGGDTLYLFSLHRQGAQLSFKDTRRLEQYSRAVCAHEAKQWIKELVKSYDDPY